jgi:hypothetical protein
MLDRSWALAALTLLAACGDTANLRIDAGPAPDADAEPDGGEAIEPADAGAPEADACVALPSDCTIPANSALPSDLRCTGLFADLEGQVLACDVRPYAPAFVLYADGAEKQRYVRIPEGTQIDVSDPNAPVFPVGTQLWKEFRIGADKRLGETRLLQKTARGWLYTSYVWNEAGTRATQTNDGVTGLFGTDHDVPTRDQCNECHVGRKDFALGWDGLLLGAGATGLDAQALAELGLTSAALPSFGPDAGAPERAALAYLHVNCGVSCHNPNAKAKAFDTGLMLRLEPGDDGAALRTGVNRAPGPNAKLAGLELPDGGFVDIAPGDPTRSLLLARMKVRGVEAQMPRIGTRHVDDAGVALIEAWIRGLAP